MHKLGIDHGIAEHHPGRLGERRRRLRKRKKLRIVPALGNSADDMASRREAKGIDALRIHGELLGVRTHIGDSAHEGDRLHRIVRLFIHLGICLPCLGRRRDIGGIAAHERSVAQAKETHGHGLALTRCQLEVASAWADDDGRTPLSLAARDLAARDIAVQSSIPFAKRQFLVLHPLLLFVRGSVRATTPIGRGRLPGSQP